jgi:hypothetical protein
MSSVTSGLWPVSGGRDTLPPRSSPSPDLSETTTLETHGPLGVIWTGLGLGAFYIALIWINSLLGLFLTPLFFIPLTFLKRRRAARAAEARR